MRSNHSTPSRCGFTLLELLLVLVVIVTISAIAWPSIERQLLTHRLQSAAEQVRAAVTEARLTAIESGSTCQFGYDPVGNQYMVFLENAEAEGSPNAVPPVSAPMLELPEGLKFSLHPATAGNPLTALAPPAGSSATAAASSTVGIPPNWAAPIHFYPDGSAEDARWHLVNEQQQHVELKVRGLTGMVTLGQVQTTAATTSQVSQP